MCIGDVVRVPVILSSHLPQPLTISHCQLALHVLQVSSLPQELPSLTFSLKFSIVRNWQVCELALPLPQWIDTPATLNPDYSSASEPYACAHFLQLPAYQALFDNHMSALDFFRAFVAQLCYGIPRLSYILLLNAFLGCHG